MRRLFLPLLVVAAAGAAAAYRPVLSPGREAAVTVRKLTPVLVVDRVEPSAAFWRERLGFQQQFEVPHDGAVGFASLTNGTVEVMYQSRGSVAADLPSLAAQPHGTVLFVEVDDLDAVERAMEGVEVVSPRRTTFYGMHEIAVREPGGNVVVFAQPAQGQGQP